MIYNKKHVKICIFIIIAAALIITIIIRIIKSLRVFFLISPTLCLQLGFIQKDSADVDQQRQTACYSLIRHGHILCHGRLSPPH